MSYFYTYSEKCNTMYLFSSLGYHIVKQMTKAITNAIIQPLKLPGFLFWLTIFCYDGLFKWNIRKSPKFQPQVKPETFQCCCCDLIWRRSTCVVGEVTAACVLQQCLLWPRRLFLKDSSLLCIESSQEPHNSASEAVLYSQSCSSAGALNHRNFNLHVSTTVILVTFLALIF